MINLNAYTVAVAVTEYWRTTYPNINQNQQLQRFSASLEEIQNHDNQSTLPQPKSQLVPKRLTISARTGVQWLHRMGYSWKEERKGI